MTDTERTDRAARAHIPEHGHHGGPLVQVVAHYEDGTERVYGHDHPAIAAARRAEPAEPPADRTPGEMLRRVEREIAADRKPESSSPQAHLADEHAADEAAARADQDREAQAELARVQGGATGERWERAFEAAGARRQKAREAGVMTTERYWHGYQDGMCATRAADATEDRADRVAADDAESEVREWDATLSDGLESEEREPDILDAIYRYVFGEVPDEPHPDVEEWVKRIRRLRSNIGIWHALDATRHPVKDAEINHAVEVEQRLSGGPGRLDDNEWAGGDKRKIDADWLKDAIFEARQQDDGAGLFGASTDEQLAEALAVAIADEFAPRPSVEAGERERPAWCYEKNYPCGCRDVIATDDRLHQWVDRKPCYEHSRPLFADMEPPSMPPPKAHLVLLARTAPEPAADSKPGRTVEKRDRPPLIIDEPSAADRYVPRSAEAASKPADDAETYSSPGWLGKRLAKPTADAVRQVDQAIKDAIHLNRPAMQVERLRQVRDRLTGKPTADAGRDEDVRRLVEEAFQRIHGCFDGTFSGPDVIAAQLAALDALDRLIAERDRLDEAVADVQHVAESPAAEDEDAIRIAIDRYAKLDGFWGSEKHARLIAGLDRLCTLVERQKAMIEDMDRQHIARDGTT